MSNRYRSQRYVNQKPVRGIKIDYHSTYTQGLVSCWLMNECSGAAMDQNNLQRTGTITGSLGWAGSSYGPAMDFGSGSKYWTVNRTVGPARNDGAWTFAALVWPNVTNAFMSIICYGEVTDANNTFGFGMDSTGHVDVFMNGNSAGNVNSSTLTLTANAWNFIACAQIASAKRIFYCNGLSQVDSTANAFAGTSAGGLSIGNSFFSGAAETASWQGLISFIYCWNRALSVRELDGLYAEPFQFFTPPPATRWYGAPVVVAGGFQPGWAAARSQVIQGPWVA